MSGHFFSGLEASGIRKGAFGVPGKVVPYIAAAASGSGGIIKNKDYFGNNDSCLLGSHAIALYNTLVRLAILRKPPIVCSSLTYESDSVNYVGEWHGPTRTHFGNQTTRLADDQPGWAG
jgi:hypothetical protein